MTSRPVPAYPATDAPPAIRPRIRRAGKLVRSVCGLLVSTSLSSGSDSGKHTFQIRNAKREDGGWFNFQKFSGKRVNVCNAIK